MHNNFGSLGNHRSRKIGARIHRQLRFEALENRRLLAITVNTLVDENDGIAIGGISLRDAIAAATAGEVIDFAPVLTSGGASTILLTNGELTINKDLTIIGPGAKRLSIDASGSDPTPDTNSGDGSRVFNVSNGSSQLPLEVTIGSLTVTGGDVAGHGGGVFYEFNAGLGTHNLLTINECAISDNSAAERGGGIYSRANLTVVNSTINSNIADFSGGIRNEGGATKVVNSTISNNIGSISGGGIGVLLNNLSVVASTISGNIGKSGGGGILNSNSQILLDGVIVAGNNQGYSSPGPNISGSATIRFSLIDDRSGATITDNGGNLIGTSFAKIDPRIGALADNGGPTKTHALHFDSPAINAGDPTVQVGMAGVPEFDQRGNPFERVSGARIDIGSFERAVVYIAPEATIVVDSTVDDLDGIVTAGNLSLREAVVMANHSAGHQTITFDDAIFSTPQTILLTNNEIRIRESVSIVGTVADRLTIDASGNDPTPDENNGDGSRVFYIRDDDLVANKNVTISGLTLTGGDEAFGGGAILNYEDTLITEVTISDNSSGGGGGVSNFRGKLHIDKSEIRDNSAGVGGGIATGGSTLAELVVTDSRISGNESMNYGGGIFGRFGSVVVTDSLLEKNSALLGGGIYSDASTTFSITRSRIIQNAASLGGGGGVFALDTDLTIDSTELMHNSAKRGGAIYSLGGATLIEHTTIANNSAESGAGISSISQLSIKLTTISGNIAESYGGGIHSGESLEVVSSTITGNSSKGFGAGVFTTYGTLTLNNSVLAGNFGTIPDLTGLVGTAVEAAFSLIGSNSSNGLSEAPVGMPDANGNLIGGPVHGLIDPKLGPLRYNGGSTPTHALLPGSPAINMGDPVAIAGSNGVPVFDQRGEPWSRIVGGRIDIGAVESQANPLGGDYNFNGVVDAADYTIWRDTEGNETDFRADGSSVVFGVPDGVVDQLDYVFWKKNFGNVLDGGIGSREQKQSDTPSSQLLSVDNKGDASVSSGFGIVERKVPLSQGRPSVSPRLATTPAARADGLIALLASRSNDIDEEKAAALAHDDETATAEDAIMFDCVFETIGR